MDNDIEVSILILTKDAEANIHRTLSMILNQKIKEKIEVTVIDSGSRDRTIEIIKSFADVRLVQRRSEEFGHGRTRNLAGRMGKGKYLVFLNGDAVPKDKYWLSRLLDNFEQDEKVVAVYSRHLPKKNCHIYMALQILDGMGPVKKICNFSYLSDDDRQRHMLSLIRFSTVSCAIRKEIWDKMPFTENLPHGEDQEWAKRMLEMGYTIIYEPTSIVFHSHNYSLRQVFKYYYDDTKSFNAILKSKKTLVIFFGKILTLPFQSLIDSIFIISYGNKKGYTLSQIVKEVIIASLARLSALFGKMYGNYR